MMMMTMMKVMMQNCQHLKLTSATTNVFAATADIASRSLGLERKRARV